MASDSEASGPVDAHSHSHSGGHSHAHGLTHNHGPTVVRVRTTAEAGSLAFVPALSLLRLSIQARLASAAVFAAGIWAAIHWATL
jgi:hypothetical protein